MQRDKSAYTFQPESSGYQLNNPVYPSNGGYQDLGKKFFFVGGGLDFVSF